MKKTAIFLICVAMLAAIFTGCNKTTPYDTTATSGGGDSASGEGNTTTDIELLSGKHYVEIDVKDYGLIKCELDADTAPITVTNFIGLVESGFYDGLTFHRIIDGFMVQGGDPKGDGTGGSGTNIKGEFSANGVENDILHVRGTVSMARASDPNSASSQFFIVQQDYSYGDGQYAGFGTVLEGMEVVDALCADAASMGPDGNGIIPRENQPVINSIKVVEG